VPFHIVSFEGPDPGSRAGGLAARVDGLAHAPSARRFETHFPLTGGAAGAGSAAFAAGAPDGTTGGMR
jgi:hypothetical protein